MEDKTKDTYEDERFVGMYVNVNSTKEHEIKKAEDFAQRLMPESKILDLGCGPGHLSYILAGAKSLEGEALNHKVIGSDLSNSMIKIAREFSTQTNMPSFVVGDMTKLTEDFEEDSLDAVYANASLLHLTEEQTEKVLEDIVKIVKNGGRVFISLKGGENGTKMVTEKRTHEGKELEFERQFTFWQSDAFKALAEKQGLILEQSFSGTNAATSGAETQWLNFYFVVKK
jgi:ubiquinone/menaquinone biosynthesis C-methylase UbiE